MKLPVPLTELESQYADPGAGVSAAVIRRLRNDPRKGARRLYERLKRRATKEQEERKRREAMLRYERQLWAEGVGRIAGVDEVGIGPMAGPVVAAAVVFEAGSVIAGVDDSKRLERAAREDLDQKIRALASGIGVGVVDTPDVDRLNVYHAGLLAMRRAVDALPTPPQHVLVDARTIPKLGVPQEGLKQGDSRSFTIAAASIVAKVYRDRLMIELDRQHPGYGFARHKGYCSLEHQEAVRRLGPSPVHRESFDFIRELTGEYDPIFYALREAIGGVETPAALAEWKRRFQSARPRLTPTAVRKLQGLSLRHSKRQRLPLTN